MSTDANANPDPDARPERYEPAPVVRPEDRTGPPQRPAQPGQPGREPEKVAEAEAQRAEGLAADQQPGAGDDGDADEDSEGEDALDDADA